MLCRGKPAAVRCEATPWWRMVFGAIGFGFCVCCKRRKAQISRVFWIGQIVFPYLVSNTWAMPLADAALITIPYFMRI
jgi:hypothetical protein